MVKVLVTSRSGVFFFLCDKSLFERPLLGRGVGLEW